MEATVFQESRRRLLPPDRAVGRHASNLAAIFRTRQYGLVDQVLPARQLPTPNGAALRRLPLGQLQRQDEDADRVERRLREMSWPGERARRASTGFEHLESGEARLRAGKRRVYPVSFARPAAKQSD